MERKIYSIKYHTQIKYSNKPRKIVVTFRIGVFAINIGDSPHVFHLDLSPVQNVFKVDQEKGDQDIFEVMDVLNPTTPAKPLHYLTQDDLVNWKYPFDFGSHVST